MSRKKITFISLLLTLVMTATCRKEGVYNDAPKNPDNARLLELINSYRKTGNYCGGEYFPPAEPLQWSNQLEAAAKNHSDDMNNNDFFDHTGSDGSDAGQRILATGYQWYTWGENIAVGYPDEKSVAEGWIKSPGHCKNIMNPGFKEMGAATSGAYWTQDFASR